MRDPYHLSGRTAVVTGAGGIGPSAHSVSSQWLMTMSTLRQMRQNDTMRPSASFTTHIKPGHCFCLGFRRHSTRVSRP